MAINPKAIELTPEQRRQLAELADRDGRSWQEVFSDALSAYAPSSRLKSPVTGRSFFDVMMENGAIGVVKGGLPHDLSTNPDHMEGFGSDRGPGSR